MDTSAVTFEGSCHCGAVGFSYRTTKRPNEWSVRACQCSFCRAHSALSTSDPAGSVEFMEHVPATLSRYRFGQRTADFIICRTCGVYLGAAMSTARGRFAIVNVNALREPPAALAAPIPMVYEDESIEQRITRREQRWTPLIGAV